MKMIFAIAALAISGCATVEQMKKASSYELCGALALNRTGGLPRQALQQELSLRGVSCSDYRGEFMAEVARENAQAANTAAALQLLNNFNQPPTMPVMPSGPIYVLTGQRVYNGARLCSYADGSVVNVGGSYCPPTK